MSSGITKIKKHLETEMNSDLELVYILSKTLIPFSKLFDKKRDPDIYTGQEIIPFREKHPIFKALMRIEFED
ncbi:MAG: hypothetical protein ACFFFB_09605 [Candidatus Heimdallarchaeota archaeon]